jgi:hypothetical protein
MGWNFCDCELHIWGCKGGLGLPVCLSELKPDLGILIAFGAVTYPERLCDTDQWTKKFSCVFLLGSL